MKLLLSTLSGIIGALSFVAFCTLILGFARLCWRLSGMLLDWSPLL